MWVSLSVQGCLCEERIEQRLHEMCLGEQVRVLLLSHYYYPLVEILPEHHFCDNLVGLSCYIYSCRTVATVGVVLVGETEKWASPEDSSGQLRNLVCIVSSISWCVPFGYWFQWSVPVGEAVIVPKPRFCLSFHFNVQVPLGWIYLL